MSREDNIDHKMLKGFYFAYKDGTPYPSTIRHSSLQDINITAEEFISSRRRLMQNGSLDGTKTQTKAGTSWSPNEISDKGIEVYESHIDPLLRGMTVIDTGYNGKRYLFWKWIKNNLKWTFMATLGIVTLILGVMTL